MLSAVFLVVVFLVAFLAVSVGPLYAADRFRETRPPTREERAQVDALRDDSGFDVDPIAIFAASEPDRDTVEIGVRGPPGRRVLFCSAGVFDLEEPVRTALFAAEAARVETYYNEFRAVAVGVVLAILAAIVTTLVPFGAGFTALAVIGFVSFWVGRRVQYAADAQAADRVGGTQLADAFEHVAAVRGVEPETGTWKTWFEVQPPLGDRIERLRERAAN